MMVVTKQLSSSSQPTYDFPHRPTHRPSLMHKEAWLDGDALSEGFFGRSVFGSV